MSLRAGDMNKGPLQCHCEPKAKQSRMEQGIASLLTHLAMTGGVSWRAEGVAIPHGAGDCFVAYAPRNDRRGVIVSRRYGNLKGSNLRWVRIIIYTS